jgi:membrane protease YdiL (CAAX protease family)
MSSPSPYRPPEAPVADQDRPRGSPVKGMLYGALVDIGGTLLAGIVLGILWGIWLAASGNSAEQIAEAVKNPDPTSLVSIAGYVIGTAFSGLGGYVCARVARETELRCAAVVAGISIAFGFAVGGAQTPEMGVLMIVTTVAAVMLGAWMGRRRNAANP